MFFKFLLAFFVSGVLALFPNASYAQAGDTEQCFSLAGIDLDPNLPEGLPGVQFSEIDVTEAISVCGHIASTLTNSDANAPSIWFTYARALMAAGEYDKSLPWLTKSQSQGFALADNGLGLIYQNGFGNTQKDLEKAEELYQAACKKGAVIGCTNLGRLVFETDEAAAYSIFSNACSVRPGYGCYWAGWQSFNGRGTFKDATQAIFWFETGCTFRDSQACNFLAWMHDSGNGVQKDISRATKLYAKACEFGHSSACYKAGVQILEKDAQHAFRLFDQGCAKRDGSSCAYAAILYGQGNGVEADTSKETKYYSLACDYENWNACYYAAYRLDRGIGAKKDIEKALSYYVKGCENGAAKSCVPAGMKLSVGSAGEHDPVKGLSYIEKACEGGEVNGCSIAGDWYQRGQGSDVNARQAVNYFEQACDGEDSRSCRKAATLRLSGEGLPIDAVAAYKNFHSGCALNDAESCYEVASAHKTKLGGVEFDGQTIFENYARACSLDFFAGCHEAGLTLFYSGDFSAGGRSRAPEYFDLACKNGVGDSCYYMARQYADGEGVVANASNASKYYSLACIADSQLGAASGICRDQSLQTLAGYPLRTRDQVFKCWSLLEIIENYSDRDILSKLAKTYKAGQFNAMKSDVANADALIADPESAVYLDYRRLVREDKDEKRSHSLIKDPSKLFQIAGLCHVLLTKFNEKAPDFSAKSSMHEWTKIFFREGGEAVQIPQLTTEAALSFYNSVQVTINELQIGLQSDEAKLMTVAYSESLENWANAGHPNLNVWKPKFIK
ncbi:Putative beta-lactamase HcpC precursor [Roseovarius albus]|uniref:Putative beta-lactamase HcpC n=2 Tax=Roseovarius albus TaxID=1247867 RepID=A0A1X7A2L8_9RHOB|nr:Putative beta-lactamase HcpC precursor [Roseovarius albus]